LKRIGLLVFLSLSFYSLYGGAIDAQSIESLGMGNVSLAFSSSYSNVFANPAVLPRIPENRARFFVSVGTQDYFGAKIINNPISNSLISFCGSNLAFTIEIQNTLKNKVSVTGGDTYDSINATRLQLDWGYSIKKFSFGASIKATTFMTRSPVLISDGQRVLDYIVESLFKRYESMNGSTTLSAGVGILYDEGWLKVAVVSSKFAYASTDGTMSFSFLELYKSFGFGLSLSSPTFNRESQLNFFKVEASAEIVNAGSSTLAEFRSGLALKFQLLPEYSVTLRTGYREPKNGNILAFNIDNGYHTMGLGIALNNFSIDCAVQVPVAVYKGTETFSSVPFIVSFSYGQ